MSDNLHARLTALQTQEELDRKADKAVSKHHLWTQEELDAARRRAADLFKTLKVE